MATSAMTLQEAIVAVIENGNWLDSYEEEDSIESYLMSKELSVAVEAAVRQWFTDHADEIASRFDRVEGWTESTTTQGKRGTTVRYAYLPMTTTERLRAALSVPFPGGVIEHQEEQ